MSDQSEKRPVNKDWWKGDKNLDSSFFEEANKQIEDIEKELASQKGEPDPEKAKLLEALIKHYLDLTKALDSRRAEYFKAGMQMFAIALAALGILVKFLDISHLTFLTLIAIAFTVGLTSALIVAFRVITLFYWQTNSERYHFLKIDVSKNENLGNSWLWFYHGLPALTKIPYTKSVKRPKDIEEANREGALSYLKGANSFFSTFINSTKRDIFVQDLKHAYLLLVHNAYKNKFDRQMTDLISKGTIVTAWITVCAVVLSIIGGWIMSVPLTAPNEKAPTVVLNDSTSAFRIKIDSIPNFNITPQKKDSLSGPKPENRPSKKEGS